MRVFCLVVVVFGLIHGIGWAQDSEHDRSFRLNQKGLLVISAGQDTTDGFHWQHGPGSGVISLTWPTGMLSLPDTLALDGFENGNLGIPLLEGFGGSAQDGPLILRDGIYPVKDNLVMTDGRIQLMVRGGELEINGPRFRYSRPDSGFSETKANLLLIAGILVLIVVLMRRARKELRKKN